MKKVLILCTGNSCRSQMAEALWNEIGKGDWIAFSAGSKPSGYVHPLAIKAMADRGVDISKNISKKMDQFLNEEFELVVTVCDHAKESCPIFPVTKALLHWPFFDPADAEGDEKEKLAVFKRVRDEIDQKIRDYLNKSHENGN